MGVRIKALPVEVANQIAAGEVIERPASVVKELLENAYDAQADSISIDIGYGGLNQIKISDNGIGILAEDLPLTVKAHATSKIKDSTDLYSIGTMGFRGEALASIASVAKLKILSKTKQQPHASLLQATGADIKISPCARADGTTVEVNDLFYNIPVRKKFLKTARLEFLAIETTVKKFALSAPHIALILSHNGRMVLNLPAAQNDSLHQKRMSRLFGHRFAKEAQYIDIQRGHLKLYGWLSKAGYQRSQNDRQWIYINQRMVKDKLISHAIKQAYEEILYPGRYPACLLYFELPVEEVDVNVHPAKSEVRFHQPRLVHDFILTQLTLALRKNEAPLQKESHAAPSSSGYTQLTVCEDNFQPLQKNTLSSFENDGLTWFNLNKEYGLIWLNHKPFLVDLFNLYKQWLWGQLQELARPLKQRSLLVPLRLQISPDIHKSLQKEQHRFIELGILFELETENLLVIRSVPLLMPHLDIQKLFKSINDSHCTKTNNLLSLLFSCLFFDAQQLDKDEKEELYGFLQQKNESELAELKIGKLLNEAECKVIFGD